MNYHKTQLLGTLSFEKHWANPKTDAVDPHQTKNGQNAPSWNAEQFWKYRALALTRILNNSGIAK